MPTSDWAAAGEPTSAPPTTTKIAALADRKMVQHVTFRGLTVSFPGTSLSARAMPLTLQRDLHESLILAGNCGHVQLPATRHAYHVQIKPQMSPLAVIQEPLLASRRAGQPPRTDTGEGAGRRQYLHGALPSGGGSGITHPAA